MTDKATLARRVLEACGYVAHRETLPAGIHPIYSRLELRNGSYTGEHRINLEDVFALAREQGWEPSLGPNSLEPDNNMASLIDPSKLGEEGCDFTYATAVQYDHTDDCLALLQCMAKALGVSGDEGSD